jgi:hypothetical protein
VTPIERTASATLCPCETSTTTCRSFATISSGLRPLLGNWSSSLSKDILQDGPIQWGWITQRRSPRLRRKQRKEQIAGAVGFRSSSVQASGMTLMGNTMWGGWFAAGPAKVMEEFNASIDFDRKLASQDIAGS